MSLRGSCSGTNTYLADTTPLKRTAPKLRCNDMRQWVDSLANIPSHSTLNDTPKLFLFRSMMSHTQPTNTRTYQTSSRPLSTSQSGSEGNVIITPSGSHNHVAPGCVDLREAWCCFSCLKDISQGQGCLSRGVKVFILTIFIRGGVPQEFGL